MRIEFTSEEWIQEIPSYFSQVTTFFSEMSIFQIVLLYIAVMYIIAIPTSKLFYKLCWHSYKNSKKTEWGKTRDYTVKEIKSECRVCTIFWIVIPPLCIPFILFIGLVENFIIPSAKSLGLSILAWWEKGLYQ